MCARTGRDRATTKTAPIKRTGQDALSAETAQNVQNDRNGLTGSSRSVRSGLLRSVPTRRFERAIQNVRMAGRFARAGRIGRKKAANAADFSGAYDRRSAETAETDAAENGRMEQGMR